MKSGKLSQHTEWLSLIEVSGPFLALSTLDKAFPQGLETVETPRRQKIRAAYEEWRDAVDQEDNLLPELHREWIRLVLAEMLEYDQESLVHIGDWSDELPSVSSQEHTGTFKPDWIVRSPTNGKPRLYIAVLPPNTDLESVQQGDGWPVSLQERMNLLCRAHSVRMGLITNGERWMLVNAPVGSTSSHASWYARLWFQEPITLKAFQSLLGVRRCFGPTEDTLESLLDESLKHHEEVTDTLGEQVRRAVEVLVQCLDKADEGRNRNLLHDVKPGELYEAGLTVMMRLVFILCAEERGLLLLGDSVYDRCYAVSTLRGQLAEEEALHGPEVLENRYDAWARLLAVFRAVYGGIEHESLRLPALGGSLFDPDRFPFLEGRAKATCWRDALAAPLPIDNRTVLLLLNSLQILEQSGGAMMLSYGGLDVEQIGHVYEGLLEHTVARVPRVTLGMLGSQKAKNPNVALAELESARLDGEEALVKLVLEVTGRSESAIRNVLSKPADDSVFRRVLGVCGGDTALVERIRPFTNLLRTDAWEDPIVYRDNSFMVTLGADRRETGTHYTPKSLTESIVTTTLEPVVYVGPAEGKSRKDWTLKSSQEILDLKVCDPAMGSGAFLVQACRYLGEKLVEAWLHEEASGKIITVDGEAIEQLGAKEPLPSQLNERLTIARRLVAERCLYGVDINPLAVELAKLSIWLVTLAKDRPFGFLDHNLRSGDSLLGIHRLEQLTRLRMDTESGRQYQLRIFGQNVEAAVSEAIELRKRIRATTIRDIRDVEAMARLDREARRKLESVELIADAIIGEALRCGGNARALDTAMDTLATMAGDFLSGNETMGEQIARQARNNLSIELRGDTAPRRPFHWALGFPEVLENGGFDGVVGNPPFLGGRRITFRISNCLLSLLKTWLTGPAGTTDLCIYFLRRSAAIINSLGNIGLVLSDIISQGESRTNGLEYLLENGFSVYNCIPSRDWPGSAGVKIAHLHLTKIEWTGPRYISGKLVENQINSFLQDEKDEHSGEPHQLEENADICFSGHYLMGQGFVLSQLEKEHLVDQNNNSDEVIFQYIRGDDINNSFTQRSGLYAINFSMRDLDACEKDFPECLDRIRSLVKPERDVVKRKANRERWWRYAEARPGLEKAISGLTKVIVQPFTAKYILPTFVEARSVFAHPLVVLPTESFQTYACIQSSIHEKWVWQYCSTSLDLLRYTASSVLSTFPFPLHNCELEGIGACYYEYRQSLLNKNREPLTKIYNQFNDPEYSSPDIQQLRKLHVNLDIALITSYGWGDIELHHDFYNTKQGLRFTICEDARRDVLQRLLKLNNERFAQQKTTDVAPKKQTRKSSACSNDANITTSTLKADLFDFLPSSSVSGNGAPQAILDCLLATNEWHAKDDIITRSGIPTTQWQSTINQLLADGLVERQGERRGAKYRALKRNH